MSVPQYPTDRSWTSVLHWTLRVMDGDDREVAFVASLLSQAIARGGLTPKQVQYATVIVDRIRDLHERGFLLVQIADCFDEVEFIPFDTDPEAAGVAVTTETPQ